MGVINELRWYYLLLSYVVDLTIFNANKKVDLAVKTPVGKTEKGSIENVIIQGDVFGPLLCSKQVDTFGKECVEEQKYTYTYK